MIETSIFGGRILPTLQPYPTIHPASPPVAPHTAWRTGDAIHTFVVTYRTYRAVFDCPWFDCGFINSHGCYPSHLATLTYLTFQLDAHLPLAGEWCGHAWNTASKSLPIWTNFAASNPNGSHVAWEMLPVSVNLQKNTQTLLGGAVVCGCIYLCIYIYIYTYLIPNLWRFKSDGCTNFSSWTAPPKCRISLRFAKYNPRPPSCSYHWLSVSIHPNLSLCGLEVHHSLPMAVPTIYMGVSQIVGLPSHPSLHHLEKYEFVS